MNQKIAASRKPRDRKGAAAVEFALTAPIFVVLLFAALEFSRVNMVRNTIETAAYEGTRRGIVPGAAASDVETAAMDTLAAAGVRGSTVDVDPPTITDDTPEVTVTVTVQLMDNFWCAPIYFSSGTISSSLTMPRERTDMVNVP